MSEETIWLHRPDENVPWGFRLLGGRDFQQPLSVQKVTDGSVAAQMGLRAGDVITRIGETETGPLTHTQSMLTMKNCGNMLQLCIARSGGGGAGASRGIQSTPGTPQSSSVRNEQPTFSNDSKDYPFGAPQYSGPQTPSTASYSHSGGSGLEQPLSNGQSGYHQDDSFSHDQNDYASQQNQYGERQDQQTPKVPDAVLNMAARGSADKKPFSYVADVNQIREQRDRVRKKGPVTNMPRYQQMLNLPQFEEAPRARGLVTQRSMSATPPVGENAVVSNLQFNSPMGLYSGDNVVEALKGQIGTDVTDIVGLPKKSQGDITQSATYKLIHGIDQPKPKAAIVYAEAHDSPLRGRGRADQQAAEVDSRDSGLNKPVDIPSRSFQMLQQSVGGGSSEIDTSSIRHNVAGEGEGEYEQKSIRYTGKSNPSKSFRMLQTMTGGEQPQIIRQAPRTPQRDPAPDDETRFSGLNRVNVPTKSMHQMNLENNATPRGGSEIDTTSIRHHLHPDGQLGQDSGDYDEKSIRYIGKNIPSRSFRLLQSMTGGEDSPPGSASPVRQQQKRPTQQRPNRSQHLSSTDAHDGTSTPEEGAKDIRYVGANIPSQTFKVLQNYVDSPDHSANEGDTLQSTQGRRVKVVRLRQQPSVEEASGSTEF